MPLAKIIRRPVLVQRWSRFPAAQGEPRKAAALAEEAEVTPEDASYVFTAPSEGDGYRFKVRVWLWRRSATGALIFRPWKELREDQDHLIKDVVRENVRETLRKHSVFAPAEAERAAKEALGERLKERPSDSVAGTWRATIEVDVPEEVRQLRCAHESRLYRITSRAKQIEVHIQELSTSRRLCAQFLTEATDGATARHAVRLTQAIEKVADITDGMLDEREEKAEKLFQLLAKIVDAQRHANAFELVMSSESALRAAFERLGVPLPQPSPDSPFALMEEPG
ncbi:hypothetical protein Nocox_32735 [Nonomuraea coxensis DSM 45129]|uniref:Uncharacterized protein n=1 Tax=Nonomuraea coxensis DSM 45129 TaxID=1122611 RepID=A0ABX8U8Q7_9ACTN|nr:hypothetical protein [Nonomuraea coxensis]QYC44118.1 hypothetical protein Nocox_32735 [Nonomuraea coxensis DSM 45129]